MISDRSNLKMASTWIEQEQQRLTQGMEKGTHELPPFEFVVNDSPSCHQSLKYWGQKSKEVSILLYIFFEHMPSVQRKGVKNGVGPPPPGPPENETTGRVKLLPFLTGEKSDYTIIIYR